MTVAGRVDAVAQSEAGTARWWQLVIGIVCMAMIANLQYGWTLFVPHIDDKYHWGKASIQAAFTIFVLLETWLVPLEGYLVDKYGPRLITLLGGLLCGVSWVMNSFAGSLAELYTAAAIGGIGAGARRTDGDGIWRRLCAHHYPHRQYDSVARIRADLPLFRIGPRHRGGGAVAVLGRPSPGLQGARDGEHSAIGAIDPSSIYAAGDAGHAGILFDVRNVRPDGG